MADDIAEVYRNTYAALVRFLYRKVWDAERAEDLAQEAFARALVHRPDNTRGWLFVVAANMARDEARRAAREAFLIRIIPIWSCGSSTGHRPTAPWSD